MESALEEVAVDAVALAVADAAAIAEAEAAANERPEPTALESISMRQNHFIYADKRMYRVYDKPGHFALIEADSAHEAFAKSGVAAPLKIERENFFTQIAIAQEMLESKGERFDVDTHLPQKDQKSVFVDLIAMDAEIAASKQPFEAMTLTEYGRKQDVIEEVAVQAPEPEALEAETQQHAAAPEQLEPTENVEQASEPQEAIAPEEAVAAAKEDMAVASAKAPQEAEEEPERSLTPEEVNALMAGDGEE